MSQTTENFLPAVTGQDLGSPTQQWDVFAQDLTVSGDFSVDRLASICFAEQFSGTDLGAKINAAAAVLNTSPGEIWVSQAAGTTITTAVTLRTKQTLRFVQGGTYLVGAAITLQQGAGIIGLPNGMADSVNTGQVVLKATSALSPMISVKHATCFVSGVTLDGNSTGSIGIKSTYTSSGTFAGRLNLSNVSVWRFTSHGISFESAPNSNEAAAAKLTRVMSLANGGSGLYALNTTDIFANECEFENNARYGVELANSGGCRFEHSDFGGNTLGGTTISGDSTSWAGANNMFVGNQFGNNKGHDITINGWDTSNNALAVRATVIVGNLFNGLGSTATANTYDAIHIEDSSQNTIVGNIVRPNSSANYRYAFRIIQNGGHTAGRDTFTGNTITSAPGTGYFLSDVTTTQFYGNNEGGATTSLFSNPYFLNNTWLKWKDASGTQQNIVEMGSDDNTHLNAVTGKGIHFQVNASDIAILTASGLALGGGTAISKTVVYSQTITPSAVNAATAAEQTFTVTGLTTDDKVIVNPAATGNATAVCAARVSAGDTIAIQFVNPTAGSLTPGAGTYKIVAIRS